MKKRLRTGIRAWCITLLVALVSGALPISAEALSPPAGTVLVNEATATYSDANGNAFYSDALSGATFPLVASALVQTIIGGAPRLEIFKLESTNPVAIGGLLTYTIHYRNAGNTPATGVVITDTLSNHLVFQNASDGGIFSPLPGGGTVTWTLGPIDPGANGAVTILSRVKNQNEYPAGDPGIIGEGTLINNTVSIRATEFPPIQTSITTAVGSSVNLSIRKYSTTGTIKPGERFTYTLVYKNNGNLQASNVRIRDQLPAGVTYVDGTLTRPGAFSARTISIPLGTLGPGAGGEVSFQVQVSATALNGMAFENTAVILSNEQGAIQSNTTVNTVATASTTPSLLFVKLDSPDPAYVGNPIVYTLVITNDGSAPLSGIVVKDTIPAKTTFVRADAGGVCVNNADNVCVETVWQIGALNPGETKSLHLEVLVNSQAEEGAVISNSAVALANEIPFPSPSATTTLAARTPGIISFTDSEWQTATSFKTGATICLQVTDLDQNTDQFLPETVGIVVSHPLSGDSENLTLLETGSNTGIFRGCFDTTGASSLPQDGILTVSADSMITATYTDILDKSPVSQDSALIDPFGVVFDSVTGLPVPGATVTLQWDNAGSWVRAASHPGWPAGQEDEIITVADGAFQFPLVPAGSYRITVIPGGSYIYPSQVPTAQVAPGYIISNGSRGENFLLSVGDPPLNFDIPVDPPPGQLEALKTANKNEAAIGDIVVYTLNLRNSGPTLAHGLLLQDILPAGIHYIPGSSRVDGKPVADPNLASSKILTWPLPLLAAGDTMNLSYHCTISGDAIPGAANNSFMAQGTSAGQAIASNRAAHTIRIREGVFTSRSLIIGKVFLDDNSDGIQTPDAATEQMSSREPGISDVALFLEDGTRVVTDRNGKFSIQGVRSGTHVLRLDESTLPSGYELVRLGNRSMGSAASQFVDVSNGLIFKANFRVRKNTTVSAPPAAKEQEERTPVIPAPVASAPEVIAAVNLEEQIKQMTPELEFLNPADGAIALRSQINIMVKGPKDSMIAVQVNGDPIPAERIGRSVVSQEKKVQVIEYISIDLIPGTTNRISASLTDPFGNPRGSKTIAVQVPGNPAMIRVDADRQEALADGVSHIAFTARILDSNRTVLTYPHTITVSATNGEFIEEDADRSASGHQVACDHGSAAFRLRAPRESGWVTVTVLFDDLSSESKIFFTPHLREMLLVGLGDIAVGEKTDKRGAFFAKGEVSDGVLLTASYDSEKESSDELFRTDEKALESEAKYQILGDESKVGYEAQSQENLYVKLEKGKSSLLFGDYATDLNQTRLAVYNRTFNGLLTDIDAGVYKLRAFGAHTSQSQTVDRLPGKGISGYYFLSRVPLIEGSERVVIETRDRLRPEHVLEREAKSRFSDYDIDYSLGSILFKAPIPSHDDAWNPVFIIVTYESENDVGKYYTSGGRASVRPVEWLEIGFSGISEEKESSDYTLIGSDITLLLPGNTKVAAEYAYTDSLEDEFDSWQSQAGDAWSFTVTSSPLPSLSLEGYYQRTSDYFYNLSATDAGRGMDKFGLKISHAYNPLITFTTSLFEEKDRLNDRRHSLITLGAERKFTRSTVGLEISREEADDDFVPLAAPTSRSPFDISEETPDDLTAAKLSLKTSLRPDLSLQLSHKQDIMKNRHNISQVGLEYQINPLNRLYIRQELGRFDKREELRTVIGGETKVVKNTVAFNEYRLDNGADGSRNQEIIGLRNTFMLGDTVTGNLSLENQTTLSGQERQDYSDAYSITGAVEYLPLEKTKLTTRAEYRKETSGDSGYSILGEAGLVHSFHPDYSLLLRERLFLDQQKIDFRRTTSKTMFGLAYRPLAADRFNGLAKLEFKRDEQSGNNSYLIDACIFSAEGVYQYNAKTQLLGKYAGKYAFEEGFSAYTDLVAGRIMYDITDRFDINAEYRLLNSHAAETFSHGGAVELGLRLYSDLWLSLGYSFDEFDTDLTGSYQDKGGYLKIRFKFDEKILPTGILAK